MKLKSTYLPQLLLSLLWFDRCDSLIDSSVPEVFYRFGTDEGDSVVTVGGGYSAGPIHIPYEIFNNRTLYVRTVRDCVTQLNSTRIYGRRCKHLDVHIYLVTEHCCY